MPFITEEIWQRLPARPARKRALAGSGASIMRAPYPRASRRQADAEAERAMGTLMDAVTAIRNIRGEMRIAPGLRLDAALRPTPDHQALFEAHRPLVETLAHCRLTSDPQAIRPANSALAVVGGSEIYVALEGVVDLAAERVRLAKEIKRAADAVGFLEAKLGRSEFLERAPAEVVEKERDRLTEQRRLRAKLEASLAWISEGRR
jgi:valyl-tRNA synthetase